MNEEYEEQNEQDENKSSFLGNVFHFIAFGIVVSVYEAFPQALFWVWFVFLIIGFIAIIGSNSQNIRIIYVLSMALITIVLDILSFYFPNIINIPETVNNTSELLLTAILFSMIVYFLISFIFHFYIKLHWINFITVTFVICLYKIFSQYKLFFITMEHNFLSFIAFLLGSVGLIGISFFLGYLFGNAFNKKST